MVIVDIIYGRVSVGSFVIYTSYFSKIQGSLTDLSQWIDELNEARLGFFRLVQLTGSGQKLTEGGKQNFPEKINSIVFNKTSFKYPHRGYVLKDLFLTIRQGEKVGIVGQSGSGKSTVAKLLLKLWLLQKGQIFINDVDILNISTEELRKNISIVPQESEIFNLTFKENITISSDKNDFNEQLYLEALKIADCSPILEKIKNDHETILGEKGTKLSGGERQRVGIARAVYKSSPLMIFDESTSSLDSKTEEMILENIENHLQDKTILWIAHRLSTLRFTDRIVVFEKGSIAEEGSFSRLSKEKGLFRSLWELQKKTKM